MCARHWLEPHSQPHIGQYVLNDIRPFDDDDSVRIFHRLSHIFGHQAGLIQTVKIKMIYLVGRRFVHLADRKCRAGDFVGAAQASHQATDKSRFATPKVAHQLYNFSTLQGSADLCGQFLGLFGSCNGGLPLEASVHRISIPAARAGEVWRIAAPRAILMLMLQLSGSLLHRPVLSLRTGGVVATTLSAIINPNNLKLEGFYCTDAFEKKKTFVLLYQDIRDIIPQGVVVNDHDALTDPHELVRLKRTMDLHFELLGKQVVTTGKSKIGKVSDYATEVDTMYIQKIYVSQSVFKSFTGGSLGIDRSQIVEITNQKIVVHDLSQGVPAGAKAVA